jgi:tetratricopeptide (TPR) repeat protein
VRRLFPLALLIASCACVRPRPFTPGASQSAIDTDLAAADALIRAGCLDCLLSAFTTYDRLRSVPAAEDDATAGAIRAALLIDLRERELGTTDDGYAARSRSLGSGSRSPADVARLADIVEATSWRWQRYGRSAAGGDLESFRRLAANRATWLEWLRLHADEDALRATVWISFACTNGAAPADRDAILQPLSAFRSAPIVQFELATCGPAPAERLGEVIQADPRYREADFFSALSAIASQQIDAADAALSRAIEWHARWPSALLMLGGVQLTGEDFDRAAGTYDAALTMIPDQPDAMLGSLKAASYGGHHEKALEQASALLRSGYFPGEAYYWRAWNEAQLDRVDAAWDDIVRAERVWVNSGVAKLAGILAYKRQQLEVARARLETANSLDPDDCETLLDLSNVLADQRAWSLSIDGFAAASGCLDREREALTREIARLEASPPAGERQARLVHRREERIAAGRRMQAQARFNAAAACFNLARNDEARRYAEQLVDDEEYGARARELLARLR